MDLANEGKYSEALQANEQGLAFNESFPLAQANKVGILVQLGRYDEAIVAADKALAIRSNTTAAFAAAYSNKGDALRHLGRIEEAKVAFAKAFELDNTFIPPDLDQATIIPTTPLAEVGLRVEAVDFVTLSHLHFDHAGGTSRFPNAKFIVQRRELEYAAGALPHNSAAKGAFVADDVLAVVQLNWQGRVLLVDGDVEGLVPGIDVYLTPGHTAGTMTTCLATVKGRVCYSSDAVYTYRNLEEDIPLGLALNAGEAVESFKKIRGLLNGGILIPGHEPRIWADPKKLGFRKVSEHAVAIVE